MLCEKCHEREATCHSTTVTDGVASSIALCDECLASLAGPAEREFFAAAKNARCCYCGGVACGGGMDSPDISPGGQQQMKFLCLRCMDEFGRFMQRQTERLPQNDLPTEEQLVAIRALLGDADRHMRQWVSERGSR